MTTKEEKIKIEKLILQKFLTEEEFDSSELKDVLKKASSYTILKQEWINIVGENQNNDISDEIYRYAWYAGNISGYHYWASNYGRIILMPKPKDYKEEITYSELKKEDYYRIKIRIKSEKDMPNGYLIQDKNLPGEITISTAVYEFVEEAFKNDDELKKTKEKLQKMYPDKTLELHHINNNPCDNRLENLIYLPKFIHTHAHKYII